MTGALTAPGITQGQTILASFNSSPFLLDCADSYCPTSAGAEVDILIRKRVGTV